MDQRLRRHALGFWQVVNKPTDSELSDYYTNKYYQSETGNYRLSYPPDEAAVFAFRIAQRAARAAEIRNTDIAGRLLDVGCGEGFVLAAFAAQGWEVEGIDHSRAGVDAMNPEQSSVVEQGNLFDLLERKIESASTYDLVWLGNVLEHVVDPIGLMSSLRRIVSSTGLLIVTVPNDGNDYQEGLFDDGQIHERFWIAIPDHISYFTADSITRIGEETGWDCADLQGDFPIDFFLAHPGSNYVKDRTNGPSAHAARLRLEKLIADCGHGAANAFYSALARVGLGRNVTAFFTPNDLGSSP